MPKKARNRRNLYYFYPTPRTVLWLVLLVGFSYVVGHGYHVLLYKTNYFKVEHVKVTGTHYLSPSVIEKLANVPMKQPLFKVNIQRIQENILQNLYVRSVSVTPVLPSTLLIDVQEREPVLYLIDRSVYFVDETGIILKKLPEMPVRKLPLVTGLSVSALLKNREPLFKAMEIVQKIKEVDEQLLSFISEIHLDYSRPPELYLIKGGARVVLGENHLYERLYLLSEFFKQPEILQKLEHIRRIDLTFKDRIIVENKS